MYSEAQRNRLKAVLSAVSDDQEKRELLEFDLAQTVNSLKEFKKEIGNNTELKQAISETQQTIKKTRDSLRSFDEKMTASYSELVRVLGDKIEQLGGTISTSYEKNKPFNAAGAYKDMINQLAAVNKSIKDKPVPVWNWPQYAGVSIRDKNFANINPQIDVRGNTVSTGTTTVTNAGTAVQVNSTSTTISRIVIQAHESNTGTIVVGDSNVVAALAGRRGWALYPTNAQEFYVNNINLLYIDSTASADKINYYVEIPS